MRLNPKLSSKYRNMLRAEDVASDLGVHYNTIMSAARRFDRNEPLGLYSIKDHRGRRWFDDESIENYVENWMQSKRTKQPRIKRGAEND